MKFVEAINDNNFEEAQKYCDSGVDIEFFKGNFFILAGIEEKEDRSIITLKKRNTLQEHVVIIKKVDTKWLVSTSSEEVAMNFIIALNYSDIEQAQKYCESGVEFQSLVGKLLSIVNIEESVSTATITIKEGSSTEEQMIELKKDNSKWFISVIHPKDLSLIIDVKDGNFGFVNKETEEVVIPHKYERVQEFSEGLAAVSLNWKWGFIDKIGKEVIPIKYDYARSFSEGLAVVKINRKYGYIDKTGKEITFLKYDSVDDFSEGLAAVSLNWKSGFIDKIGKEVIPIKYDYVRSFSEGLAVVKINSKYGYIDKIGKEITSLKYDSVYDFSEGLAVVEINGKYGYINKKGNEVIPLRYDIAWNFSGGKAKVEINDKEFYIDEKGNCVEYCESAPADHP